MPLSKAKNRERMRESRLHKRLLSLTESKPVQPKPCDTYVNIAYPEVDADGNPIPEVT